MIVIYDCGDNGNVDDGDDEDNFCNYNMMVKMKISWQGEL